MSLLLVINLQLGALLSLLLSINAVAAYIASFEGQRDIVQDGVGLDEVFYRTLKINCFLFVPYILVTQVLTDASIELALVAFLAVMGDSLYMTEFKINTYSSDVKRKTIFLAIRNVPLLLMLPLILIVEDMYTLEALFLLIALTGFAGVLRHGVVRPKNIVVLQSSSWINIRINENLKLLFQGVMGRVHVLAVRLLFEVCLGHVALVLLTICQSAVGLIGSSVELLTNSKLRKIINNENVSCTNDPIARAKILRHHLAALAPTIEKAGILWFLGATVAGLFGYYIKFSLIESNVEIGAIVLLSIIIVCVLMIVSHFIAQTLFLLGDNWGLANLLILFNIAAVVGVAIESIMVYLASALVATCIFIWLKLTGVCVRSKRIFARI